MYYLGAKIICESGNLSDVECLDFEVRNAGFIDAGREIRVTGQINQCESQFLDALFQAFARGLVVIVRRDMRALGHQCHAVETEFLGLDEGLIDR